MFPGHIMVKQWYCSMECIWCFTYVCTEFRSRVELLFVIFIATPIPNRWWIINYCMDLFYRDQWCQCAKITVTFLMRIILLLFVNFLMKFFILPFSTFMRFSPSGITEKLRNAKHLNINILYQEGIIC